MAFVALLCTSCSDVDGRVGLRLTGNGDLQVDFAPCGPEDLSEARLVRVRGEHPDAHTDTLVASAGPLERVPARISGTAVFSVEIPLDEDLPLHAPHAVFVGSATHMFLPSQLRADLYRTGEGLVSRTGLAELAASECGTGEPMVLVRLFGGLAVFSAVFILATLVIGATLIFLIRYFLVRKAARRDPLRRDP
jgi:hypothetical protein